MNIFLRCALRRTLGIVCLGLLCLLPDVSTANDLWGQALPYTSFQNVLLPFDANVVNTMAQDSDGMVWIGTKHGLYNYNGFDAHRFNTKAVQAIVPADGERLYVGGDGGLLCFDLPTETFLPSPAAFQQLGYVRSLICHKGTIYVGTRDNGLFAIDADSQKLTKLTAQWADGCIFSMAQTERGLYIGAEKGLSYYDFQSRRLRPIGTNDEKLSYVFSLFVDHADNCLLIGTGNGLLRYDIQAARLTSVTPIEHDCINDIAQDREGRLLLATDRGMLVVDKQNAVRRIVHDSQNALSLRNNTLHKVLVDRNANVWLATSRGISITQPQSSVNVIPLSQIIASTTGNVFSAILRDSKGDYWLGGDNGLIRIAGNNGSQTATWFSTNNASHVLQNNQIRCIYEDREGDVWIATDASIAHYDRAADRFRFFRLTDARRRNASWSYAIVEDSQGRLCVSTYQGGLYVVDKQALLASNGSYTMRQDLFGANDSLVQTAYHMAADDKGNLWLNFGGGITKVDMRTLKTERHNAFLDNIAFLNHNIWYSENGALKRHDPSTGQNTTTTFANKEGLIYTLVPEHDNLWFSTANGIYCFDTRTMTLTNSFVCKQAFLTGFFDAQNNELLWGGEDCLMRISLSNLTNSAAASGRLRVTGILINGERENTADGRAPRFGNELQLSDGRNVVFEFSTLDYSNPDEINIYYRLDNDEWHALGKGQNKMAFAALPSGRSTLQICNANPDIDPQATVTSYTVRVPWPWYLRWWMWTIYVLLFCSAIVGIARTIQRRNRQKFQQREKEKSLGLSRQKMDFFVNMSHELKTPLSLVIAPLGVLAAETTNTKIRERLKPIQENAMRLSNLIGRILDFKRMEYESEDVLIRSHVELCSLLQNCLHAFESTASERHIGLHFTANVERLWINADMMKLESIFINLISNAVKYVSDGTGKVSISLSANADKVCISVEDNGKGMAEEDIPMMAIRFFQGKNARKVGGTGIGFYLVKKFTELHGGTVGIRNNNGLTVSIELPIVGDNAIADPQSSTPPTENAENDKHATLLIVDDNCEITDFLSQTLSASYHCLTAHNGKEGLEGAKQHGPDLIIVDQMMPVMNGLEFCRQLRRLPQMAVIPIIMLTAKDDDRTELDSIRAGVDVFMPKPFDMKRLSLQIVQLLQKRQRMETAVNIRHIANPDFEGEPSQERRSADEILLEQVTAIIEENMEDEGFGVAALSEKTHLDQKQLYRKLTQLTGLTTIAYIKKLRMKKAAVLLSEGKFTVSETMYLVGYSNASYFTKCFQAEFGMSPKQYAAEKRS